MSDASQLVQFLFSGLTSGSIYALIAVSLVIVYKVSLLICFAQGEFFVVGALTMATLVSKGIPMPLAFVLSIIIASILGAVIEKVLIRPIRDSGVGMLIVMTTAISLAARGSALLIWGKNSYVMPPYTTGSPLHILGATLQLQVPWIVGITCVVLVAIWLFFEKTASGIAVRAVAENPLGASLMGISTGKATLFSWAWGAAIGALAGMAVSPLLFMQYTSGIMPMVKGFIAMSIGGVTSIAGAVLAGYLLGIVEAYTVGLVSSQFSDPIVFAMLIVVLLLRPNGLFGMTRSREV